MNYRQLQKSLKPLKTQGLTNLKLNTFETALRAEYERLETAGAIPDARDRQHAGSPRCSQMTVEDSTGAIPPVASSQQLSSCDEEIELDPKIEALVAENWTDNPEQAIATAAVYAVAGLAMVVLWIALIAITLTISGLKCWYWCQKQLADLNLQLKYFEPPFEQALLTQSPINLFAPVRSLLIH